jgi:hypothetical protein
MHLPHHRLHPAPPSQFDLHSVLQDFRHLNHLQTLSEMQRLMDLLLGIALDSSSLLTTYSQLSCTSSIKLLAYPSDRYPGESDTMEEDNMAFILL